MTDESLLFERVQRGDDGPIDAIVAIQHASFATPWPRESFVDLLQSPAGRVYRVRAGEATVGFCACWLFDDELHVNLIAVAGEWRRQGLGRRLMEHALSDSEARRATLEVRRSNVAARRMYERLGFKVTAVREDYYANPTEDALILWLNP